jgi:hypothetical protein
MNGAQSNVAIEASETDREYDRIDSVLSDCHGVFNDLESKLQPVLKPLIPEDAQIEKVNLPSTPRHATLQSYAHKLTDLRNRLLALVSRIEV